MRRAKAAVETDAMADWNAGSAESASQLDAVLPAAPARHANLLPM